MTQCKDLLVNIDDVGKTGEEVREYEWSELSNQKVTIILRVLKIIQNIKGDKKVPQMKQPLYRSWYG